MLYCTSDRPNNTNIPNTVKTFIQIPVKNVAGLENSIVSFLEVRTSSIFSLFLKYKNIINKYIILDFGSSINIKICYK